MALFFIFSYFFFLFHVCQIPYAGSETHLHELVENICDKMTDYGVQTIPDMGTVSYVRFQPRGDEPVELEHVSYSEETGKRLKKAVSNDVFFKRRLRVKEQQLGW